MNLPVNGRVIIVDDKLEEEAKPLIEALSKNGIAVRFFTGRASALPEKPLTGVRLVFLDMVLEGMDFTMETDHIVKSLISVLDRLISPDNGPYVMFGWTNTPKHLQALIKALPLKPVLCLDMEKSECFSDPTQILQKIESKLAQRASEIGALQILFRWENLVHDSAYLTVNDFYSLSANEANPTESLDSVLFRLAKAGLGKQIAGKKPEEVLASSLICLNGPFLDKVETMLQPSDCRNVWSKVPKIPPSLKDVEINAKINSQIHLSQCKNMVPEPGNIYEPWDDLSNKILPEMVKDSFDSAVTKEAYIVGQKKIGVDPFRDGVLTEEHRKAAFAAQNTQIAEIIKNSKCCLLEVSPFCDHSQNKWKNHRLLPCLVWPVTFANHLKRNADFLFVSPTIFNTSCSSLPFKFIFDFRHFHAREFGDVKNRKPLFRFRKELVNEIQTRLSRHINRPGIFEL